MKRKAKFDLSMPIPQKLQRTQEIIDKMGSSANFPTPAPPLVEVRTAREELATAYQAALDGGLTAKAEQRTKNAALNDKLRPLRDYVNEIAQGDEDIVLSSGFEASKVPSPVGTMPQVVDLRGKGGDGDGSIKLRWTPVYGAKNYVVEQSLDGIVFTPIAYPVKATRVLDKLTVGQFYHYQVAANGAAGLGAFSPAQKVLAS